MVTRAKPQDFSDDDPTYLEPIRATEKVRDRSTISIHPMQLCPGYRFTDKAGDWVVVNWPVSVCGGGKSVRARVRVPGQPASERDAVWEAHERITVRRDT